MKNVLRNRTLIASVLFGLACLTPQTFAQGTTPQTITWTGTTEAILKLNTAYPLDATASSGLPVTLRVQSGPAVIGNGTITATAPGTIWVSAEQAGDATYLPVIPLTRSFNPLTRTVLEYYESSGPVNGLHLVGNYLYVAAYDRGMQVIDVSDLANPQPLGGCSTEGIAQDLQVVGNHAYVAASEGGLQIIDVTDPTNPVRAGGYDTSGIAFGLQVVGNYAFVADSEAGLQVIDVTNPKSPVRVGGYDTAGTAVSVRVMGNYAYVADGSAGLQVINISDPANPIWVGEYVTGEPVNDVKVVGRYAYLAYGQPWDANESGGLEVIDVTDPANPLRVGGYNPRGNALAVEVVGNYAYLVWQQNFFAFGAVSVIDISDPAHPVEVGTSPASYQANAVKVAGNTVYVANGGDGLQIFQTSFNTLDFAPPTEAPITTGFITLPQTSSNGQPVTYSVISGPARVQADRLIFTGAGTVTLRADQPSDDFFTPINAEWTIHIVQSPQAITWTGTQKEFLPPNTPYPLSASASSGLPVTLRLNSGPAVLENGMITVTGPGTVTVSAEQPGDDTFLPAAVTRRFNLRAALLKRIWAGDYGGSDLSAALSGNYAFVGDVHGSIRVVDVSDPANPAVVRSYQTAGQIFGLQVIGNYLYVASLFNGLEILDVSNPTAPVRVGLYPARLIFAAHVVGAYAYVVNGDTGLEIIDVSDPYSPVRVGVASTFGQALGVQVVDNKAYVTDAAGWLQVIDVSNRTSPTRIGSYQFGDQIETVQVVGNYAYLAERNVGLQVVDVRDPANLVRVGGYTTLGDALGLQVFGNYAYVAAGNGGLQLFDVRNPADPIPVGAVSTGGPAYAVRVDGNYAFVANETYGDTFVPAFQIFDLTFGYRQTLELRLPAQLPFQAQPIASVAVADSDLPVTLSVLKGIGDIPRATIVNNQLVLNGLGQLTLHAEQPGNDLFLPATAEWTLTVTGPQLGLRRTDGGVELFWAAGLSGFKLQSAESLAPGNQWQDITATPVETNGEATLGFETSVQHHYFRLVKP